VSLTSSSFSTRILTLLTYCSLRQCSLLTAYYFNAPYLLLITSCLSSSSFYHKDSNVHAKTVQLADGDLIVMGGTLQETHKHEVPKIKKSDLFVSRKRINYTVRAFKTNLKPQAHMRETAGKGSRDETPPREGEHDACTRLNGRGAAGPSRKETGAAATLPSLGQGGAGGKGGESSDHDAVIVLD
jgi:hypothetical protein